MNIRERILGRVGTFLKPWYEGFRCSRCRERVDKVHPVPDYLIPHGWKSWYVCAKCLKELKEGNGP